MSLDISGILEGWDYRPHQLIVRKIVGDDGCDKIQMRVDLGVLQMEWTDRPDGKRPHGRLSLLDHYQTVLEQQKQKYGTDTRFSLSHEDCEKLQGESYQYYYRRISFFELEAYDEAGQDADHNLAIMDLVRAYASEEKDKLEFEQYRPFVIMHRTRARGLSAVQRKDVAEALRYIEEGIEEIESFFRLYDRSDLIEQSNELKVLREWAEQIGKQRLLTPEEQLRAELQTAIDNEEFERAAEIRDELKKYQ
ncbi:MAG: UvrB/UvrC motif-containing protein [candidate division Zixibacteria bacterium]|nr:UvrB/UvrC motif-containing protein [candidate division Zixibacteria bacterium]